MDPLTAKVTASGAFALALVNLLSAWGVLIPVYLSATAVTLVNAAALAVAGAFVGIKHLLDSKNANS
jgi:hypothetical protein